MTGAVTIIGSMPEAQLASEMVLSAQNILQDAITGFKVQKAKEELEFIQQRYNERKSEYENSQSELASFQDRNNGLSTSKSKSQEYKLQTDFDLKFEVFRQLSQRLENARIKVQEETPSFIVIDPVVTPIERVWPKRKFILTASLFIGLLVSITFVFLIEWYGSFSKRRS